MMNDIAANSPPHLGAIMGSAELLEQSLQRFSADEREDGYTAMHFATQFGHLDCMEVLRGHGADIDAKDAIGDTPLHKAADHGQTEAARWLVNNGACLDVFTDRHETPVLLSAKAGNVPCTELLVGFGMNTDAADQDGKTPLEWAKDCHTDEALRAARDRMHRVHRKTVAHLVDTVGLPVRLGELVAACAFPVGGLRQ